MVVVPDLVAPVVPAGRLRDQRQPELFVDELTLRPWQLADAPAVVRAYQDPAVQRWHLRTMSDREAEEWIATWSARWAAETGAGWAVCDDQGLLARMTLRAVDLAEGTGEVAYWVLPEARGRGVTPRALRAMSTWSFVHVGLHRLELAHLRGTPGPAGWRPRRATRWRGPSDSKPCTWTAGTTCTCTPGSTATLPTRRRVCSDNRSSGGFPASRWSAGLPIRTGLLGQLCRGTRPDLRRCR